MADIGIVIKALEYCIEHDCSQCFYREQCSKTGVKQDAIELLKEQQERIETLESLRRIEQEGR